MEVNKDEAERCIQLAEGHIKEKNREKAEKLLYKAERLFPTQRAKDLHVQIQFMAPAATEQEQQARKRKVTPKSEESAAPLYSKEKLEAVKRIKSCNNHYEVLGIKKDATDSEIKKNYKKLALLLHPDKNKCPGSAEAFKAIGNANAVLTDPVKRREYDVTRVSRIIYHRTYTSYKREFESAATKKKEEQFNTRTRDEFENDNFFARFKQQIYTKKMNRREKFFVCLPTLLAIVFSVMAGLFTSDPLYSFEASSKYTVLRRTEILRVPYFVMENFYTAYQGSVRGLEASIRVEYLENLKDACNNEKMFHESKNWKNIRAPSCEKLQNLRKHGA